MKVVWCFFVLMLTIGGGCWPSFLATGLCAVFHWAFAVCIDHALRPSFYRREVGNTPEAYLGRHADACGFPVAE